MYCSTRSFSRTARKRQVRSAVSPPLTEALAAAEQTLGRPVQAAAVVSAILTRGQGIFYGH